MTPDEMDESLQAEAREKLLRGKDIGHTALLKDLNKILLDAVELQFHDYLNEKHAFPKMELHNRLMAIDKKLQVGKYDN